MSILGFNYTGMYQVASRAKGGHDAAGGDFDFFGQWHLTGTDDYWPGDLVFSTETRHAYGDIPPAQLGDRIDSLWGTTVDFDNQEFDSESPWQILMCRATVRPSR